MAKLIIEHARDGVFFYHETERQFRCAEKTRRSSGLRRVDWDDLADECAVDAGSYMVVDIIEVDA